MPTPPTADQVTVTTLAGSTTAGDADGAGPLAAFNYPFGVAVDAGGNVYVADSANHSIRKISPSGAVTTLAGSPTPGASDGTGAAASFNNPAAVAVDSAGNVYVADAGNNSIRKITPARVVTTLAGSTAAGAADGTGAAAAFHHPYGVSVDTAGNIYVADTENHLIRKVTPAGGVTTLAGSTTPGSADGAGALASFRHPFGVAVDRNGNVYVSDTDNHLIRKIAPSGLVSTLAGTPGGGIADGTGASAAFYYPKHLAVDSSGNVYVGDADNYTIRTVTPWGVVRTLAGTAVLGGSLNGTGTVALFNYPQGVAVDTAGNVYVGDTFNHMVRKLTRTP